MIDVISTWLRDRPWSLGSSLRARLRSKPGSRCCWSGDPYNSVSSSLSSIFSLLPSHLCRHLPVVARREDQSPGGVRGGPWFPPWMATCLFTSLVLAVFLTPQFLYKLQFEKPWLWSGNVSHVSQAMCHMSSVNCIFGGFLWFFLLKVGKPVSGWSVINIATPSLFKSE